MTQTASGLYYQDLVVGTGAEAVVEMVITAHYEGWLVDGTKIGSSRDEGTPARFSLGVGGLIAGWEEGVQGVRVGGIRKLVIPPKLGFGEKGSGSTIPPNAWLVFDIEVLEVADPNIPPDNSEFAPELNVDLTAMTETASGLFYYDLLVGTGTPAAAGNVVTVHYEGWLIDGTKFDSSRDRGRAFSFTLGSGQVIAGWDEGVQGVNVGGIRKLVIPPKLGYGLFGAAPSIPPNAWLVFDVEVLDVQAR
ncbi:MAG: FKBP-type peptidyl-prolyl cis-trans isomerase [Gemmatimonadota bacterium]|nr:FKBP-type peptidyl-prolyl cis-trans isomerase [Gemmatimonadota bacterium]